MRGVRLSHLPPILSFHLARFRYRRVEKQPGHMGCLPLCGERDGDHRLVKLTTPLRFSQTLHMAEFTGAEPTAGGGASAAAASANDASAAAASADVSADAAAAAAADADASSVASPDVSRRLDLELTDADEDDPPAAAAISGASSGARGSAERPEAMATGEPQPQPQPPQQATSQQQQAGLDYELYAVVMHVGSPSNGHYYALIQVSLPKGPKPVCTAPTLHRIHTSSTRHPHGIHTRDTRETHGRHTRDTRETYTYRTPRRGAGFSSMTSACCPCSRASCRTPQARTTSTTSAARARICCSTAGRAHPRRGCCRRSSSRRRPAEAGEYFKCIGMFPRPISRQHLGFIVA